MNEIFSKSFINLPEGDCTGCGLCSYVCPLNIISLSADREGFARPRLISNKCNNCGVCASFCPANKTESAVQKTAEVKDCNVYAAANKNTEVLSHVSSGGVFTAIATKIINSGGTVFGAAFNKKFQLSHHTAKNLSQLSALQGSKYVQSDTSDIYSRLSDEVESGKSVLFTGTPCQAAAVLSLYRGQPPENLYVCDLICHGVPSQKVLNSYLRFQQKSFHSKVKDITFRDKTDGWEKYAVRICFENGAEYKKRANQDLYMHGYIQNTYLRPCCYSCQFKKRFTDLTIGDYWGYLDTGTPFDKNAGISAVITGTSKGRRLLLDCYDLTLKTTKFEDVYRSNPSVVQSAEWNPNRDRFYRAMRWRNFKSLHFRYINEYYEPPVKRFSNKLKVTVKHWILKCRKSV